jgi:hypothetical protein
MLDLSPLPKTLLEWRNYPYDTEKNFPRGNIWQHLETFFGNHGLTLWVQASGWTLKPPNSNERCPDPFAYRVPYTDEYGHAGDFDLVVCFTLNIKIEQPLLISHNY